ncbi:LysR family transcriptional regulator [Herbaspirillum huttiense]|uniref:LysR family transcriptional regulator n=1 Tax=Herbaspirillum huttiense TaxID=863372 RepID=UPI0031D10BB6
MNIDLNLVRTFVAVYETRSVSAAAKRLNITQPSVSYSLQRLRDLLQDPLFTRTRNGMLPTFNATQLFATFKGAIDNIQDAISAARQFDPSSSTRRFRIALSDLGESHFLPYLVRELESIAPSVGLEVIQIDSEKIGEWLSTSHIDAAVGNLEFVGAQILKRKLFTESYSCVVSTKHPTIGNSLSLEQYVAAKHVVVSPFTGHHLVEDVMSEMGIKPIVALRVPHFTSLLAVVATTDLMLTLPSRIAKSFARDGSMRSLPPPIPIPSFDVNLYWYPHSEDAMAQQWFCETIIGALSNV